MPPLEPTLADALDDVPEPVVSKVMTLEPSLARFRAEGRELLYVGSRHEEEESSPTFRLLARVFDESAPGAVVVEGSPRGRGALSAESVRALTRVGGDGLWENGERGWAIALAARRGIPAYGGEPSDREIVAALRGAGFEAEDALGMGFLAFIPQWTRLGELGRETAESLFAREMPRARRSHGLGRRPAFGWSEFLRWYERRDGRPFDARRVDFELLSPCRDGGSFLQRASHEIGRLRDRTILAALESRLRRGERVLAVFGNGHLACQWRALVAAFGEPVSFDRG